MTYDDDFARLELNVRTVNVLVGRLGFEWPPPERIYMADGGVIREALATDEDEYVLVRVSHSQITDEQREGMTHVARGALYRYVANLP